MLLPDLCKPCNSPRLGVSHISLGYRGDCYLPDYESGCDRYYCCPNKQQVLIRYTKLGYIDYVHKILDLMLMKSVPEDV